MENTKKIVNIDSILEAKKARNIKAKPIILSNAKKQNKQIALQYGLGVEENVLGEVDNDLQEQCLDEEYKALERANVQIKARQEQVLNMLEVQNETEYVALVSREEEIIECDFEEIGELKALPTRQSRFNNKWLLNSSEENNNALPPAVESDVEKPSRFNKTFL